MKSFLKENWFKLITLILLALIALILWLVLLEVEKISYSSYEVADGIEVEIVDDVDKNRGLLPTLPKLPF